MSYDGIDLQRNEDDPAPASGASILHHDGDGCGPSVAHVTAMSDPNWPTAPASGAWYEQHNREACGPTCPGCYCQCHPLADQGPAPASGDAALDDPKFTEGWDAGYKQGMKDEADFRSGHQPPAEPTLDVEALARAIDEAGMATIDETDWSKTRYKWPTELAEDVAPRYAAILAARTAR